MKVLISPQFRATGRSNRSGRLAAEQDVFEGLPVRQWRQRETTYGLPSGPGDIVQDSKSPFPEMPMPRESQFLAPHTQALLRAARKPRFMKVTVSETEADDDAEAETSNWSAPKWTQIPRPMEDTEVEYLAKRRKGLPALSNQFVPSLAPDLATRIAKVRRTDDKGTTTIYQVITMPEPTKTLTDEVLEEVAMSEITSLPPGTVIDGIGIADARGMLVSNELLQPQQRQRRRPPIPRKRKGGPGRGKKKVAFTGVISGQPVHVKPDTAGADNNADANTTPAPADDDEDDDENENDNEDEEGDEEDGEIVKDADADMEDDMNEDLEAGEIYEPEDIDNGKVTAIETLASEPSSVIVSALPDLNDAGADTDSLYQSDDPHTTNVPPLVTAPELVAAPRSEIVQGSVKVPPSLAIPGISSFTPEQAD